MKTKGLLALIAVLITLASLCVGVNICEKYGEEECKERSDDCTLCTTVKDLKICVETEIAEKLPEKLFKCDFTPPEPPFTVDCQGLDENSCNTTPGCEWCKSMAIKSMAAKSACYSEQEAHRLPPAVFQCTHPTF